MVTEENLPKALIGQYNRDVDSYYGEEDDADEPPRDHNAPQIVRPDLEIEMPDFIA